MGKRLLNTDSFTVEVVCQYSVDVFRSDFIFK